jgi:type VII secretion protein EccB
VQTRRDQLQAYRFQNKRALAALVTGEPNVVEPPMRRLTVLTIAGIMIAVLVVVVFALIGKFSPDAGDSWKDAGAIIIENDTGAIYLYDGDNNQLHPVVNYTSAVLALQSQATAHVVHVDPGDIKSAKPGYPIGLRGLPFTVPQSSDLVDGPWSVCSTQTADPHTTQVQVRTVVNAGSARRSGALPVSAPVLVRSVRGNTTYVLVDHQRLAIDADVAAALQLTEPPLPVGTAFLDGVPAGAALRAPQVQSAGDPSTLLPSARVGQLVKDADNGKTVYVLLRDGFQALPTLVDQRVMQTLRIGGVPLPQLAAQESVILANRSTQDGVSLLAALNTLPASIGTPPSAAQRAGVCAVYAHNSVLPRFAFATGAVPQSASGGATESAGSARGVADQVVLPSGGAALVKSDDHAGTTFLIAGEGEKFAAAGDALSRFKYDAAKATTLPRQLLPLIPNGPALDPSLARRPASGSARWTAANTD